MSTVAGNSNHLMKINSFAIFIVLIVSLTNRLARKEEGLSLRLKSKDNKKSLKGNKPNSNCLSSINLFKELMKSKRKNHSFSLPCKPSTVWLNWAKSGSLKTVKLIWLRVRRSNYRFKWTSKNSSSINLTLNSIRHKANKLLECQIMNE